MKEDNLENSQSGINSMKIARKLAHKLGLPVAALGLGATANAATQIEVKMQEEAVDQSIFLNTQEVMDLMEGNIYQKFELIRPRINEKAPYGYDQVGARTYKLTGELESYKYFGSEMTNETGPFHVNRPTNAVPAMFGDMAGFGVDNWVLVANYGPDGMAHYVLVPGTLMVFEHEGKIYALGCGNLVVILSYGSTAEPTTTQEEIAAPQEKTKSIEYVHWIERQENYLWSDGMWKRTGAITSTGFGMDLPAGVKPNVMRELQMGPYKKSVFFYVIGNPKK